MTSSNSIIIRTAVESSCLASVGYQMETEMLEIEFRSGAVYQYFRVPFEIYRGFIDAESKGRFFSHFIRTRYSTKKLNVGVPSIAPKT
jgi:hypothetical protein